MRVALVILALLTGVAAVIGWSFELPRVDGTVDAGTLIIEAATIGAGIGLFIGILGSFLSRSFLGKFQTVATAVIILTIITPLLAHVTNRELATEQTEEIQLPVKQVTAEWSGRGLTRDALSQGAEGYSIYVEAEEGLIKLHKVGAEAPEIGATRSLPVYRNPGYWGYPLYSLAPVDTSLIPSFE